MKCKKVVRYIVFGFLGTIILGLVIYNTIENDNFCKAPLTSFLTLVVAILVSYFYTKKNQDEHYQKEVYLHLLEKLQTIVNDERMYSIKAVADITIVIMKKRDMNNIVSILKKYSEQFGVEEEINVVGERVQEYATIIGNHQDDLEFLQKGLPELQRPLNLIDTKLSEAMLKLFD